MKFFTLTFILLCFTSCASKLYLPPSVAGVDLGETRKQIFIDNLRREALLAQSFKGLYRVTTSSPEHSFTQRYAVLIKRPEQIRLDILPVNSAYTLTSLSVKAGTSVILSPQDKTALITKNFPRVINQIFGFYLQPEELIGALLGTVESSVGADVFSKSQLILDSDYIWLQIANQEYWKFDAKTNHLVYGHVRDRLTDNIKYEVQFSDFIDQAGIKFPKHILISVPQEEIVIEAKLTSAGVNLEIDDQKFILQIPSEYDVRRD